MTTSAVDVPVIGGIVGGFLAAFFVTGLLPTLVDDVSAPSDLFLATYVGDGQPEQFQTTGDLLHLGYGTMGGAVLAMIEPRYPVPWAQYEPLPVGLMSGIANGVIFGGFLFALALGIFRLMLDVEFDRINVAYAILFHVAYGAILGILFGFHLSTSGP